MSEKPEEKRDLTDAQNDAFREVVQALKRVGVTQVDLGKHFGGDQSGWSKFLSRKQGLSVPRARALAKYARIKLGPKGAAVVEAALATLPREEAPQARAPNYDRASAIAQHMLTLGEIDSDELTAVESQIVVELGFASSGTFTPVQEADAGRRARAHVRGRAEAFRVDAGEAVPQSSTLAVARPGKLVARSKARK